MKRFAPLAVASLFALALSACGGNDETAPAAEAATEAAAPASPADVVSRSAAHLRDGDLLAVTRLVVPPAEFERMKQKWAEDKVNDPPSEEERQQFAEMMAKLTAPDAEDALMAEFEPHLVKYDAEMAAQMPLMIGMGRGFAVQAIQENKELSEEQKQQATQTLDAVAKWLGETNFSDRERAREAVRHAVETARSVGVTTLEEVQALEFEQMLQKAGLAFNGIKQVLAVYGMDLDATLASVSSNVVSETGDTAVVDVQYQLFGQPLSFQSEMARVDGRWYGKDMIEQLARELDDVEDAAEDAVEDGTGFEDEATAEDMEPVAG